jgi:hypothetical protein
VPGRVPGLLEHQILDRDQFERAVGLRLVDQDRRLQKVRVSAGPVHAGIGRGGDAEQVGAEEVNAHHAEFGGLAHHLGRVAQVQRVADVALGECNVHVPEALGCGPDCLQARRGRQA